MSNLHNKVNPLIQETIDSIIKLPQVLEDTGNFYYTNRRSSILEAMQATDDKDSTEVMGIMDVVNSLVAMADLISDHVFSKSLINIVSDYLSNLNTYNSFSEISKDMVAITTRLKAAVREAKMATVQNMDKDSKMYLSLISDRETELLNKYKEYYNQSAPLAEREFVLWMLISVAIEKDLRATYDVAQGVETENVKYKTLMKSRQLVAQILFFVHYKECNISYIEDIIDFKDAKDIYSTQRELVELLKEIQENL